MKKTVTIIIMVFLLILAGVGAWLYFGLGGQNSNQDFMNTVKEFLPFGTPSKAPITPSSSNNNQTSNNKPTQPISRDRYFQISGAPVAGYVVIATTTIKESLFASTTKATTTKVTDSIVRFAERATGHIFDEQISNQNKSRVSNETIAKVYNAIFNPKGDTAIYQFIENGSVVNREIQILASSTKQTILQTNSDQIINFGDGVAYVKVGGASGATIFSNGFDGKKETKITNYPLNEINIQAESGDAMTIYTKPHSEYPGLAFLWNSKAKKSNQVLSQKYGLTTSSNPDGSFVLYSTSDNTLSLLSKNVKKDIDVFINTNTLPEKCVWSKKYLNTAYCASPLNKPSMPFPESWYQGKATTFDQFVKVNAETGEVTPIYNPVKDGKPSPDAIKLELSADERFLFLINKKDLSLWGLEI